MESHAQIRLALMAPVALVVLLSLIWSISRNSLSDDMSRRLGTTLCHLNALQLTTAIVFLAIAWSKQNTSDWFHIQFALHMASIGAWSTSLAALVIPNWFTRKMFQFPALIGYFVLYVLNLRRLDRQMSKAMERTPHCFTSSPFIVRPAGVWGAFVAILLLFLFLAVFNREPATQIAHYSSRLNVIVWKSRHIILLQLVPFINIGMGFYITFISYSLQKHLLSRSEDEWTPGQIMPVCFVVIGSFADLWNVFDMDGEYL